MISETRGEIVSRLFYPQAIIIRYHLKSSFSLLYWAGTLTLSFDKKFTRRASSGGTDTIW